MPKLAGTGAIVHDFISVGGRQLRKPLYHTAEFEGFVGSDFRTLGDQICST